MNKTQKGDFQHPVVPAMAVSSSYYFENSQAVIEYHQGIGRQARYARYDNFGWELLEQQLAKLDACEAAVVFPSGMAAVFTTIMALCQQGRPSDLFKQRLSQHFYPLQRAFAALWLADRPDQPRTRPCRSNPSADRRAD